MNRFDSESSFGLQIMRKLIQLRYPILNVEFFIELIEVKVVLGAEVSLMQRFQF